MPPYISWPAGFDVPVTKVTLHLLNPSGQSPGKARWWLGQGFTTTRLDEMLDELHRHTNVLNFVGIRVPDPSWGHRLIFEGPIRTPNRTTPRVRSVWQVDYATPTGLAGIARLITAHRI